MDHIDAHPDQWDQSVWGVTEAARLEMLGNGWEGCGTAYCLAGWACVLNGDTPIWDETGGTTMMSDENGAPHDIEPRAQKLLGLTRAEADSADGGIFAAGNTRATLQRIAKQIAARAGEVL